MRCSKTWVVLILFFAGFLVTACAQASQSPDKIQPSTVEEIEGSELKRVILTEKAAERLGIQTDVVRDEQVIRNEVVVGEVVDGGGGEPASPDKLVVRTRLTQSDFQRVARDRPAVILPVTGEDKEDLNDEEEGLEAKLDEALNHDEDEENTLYYSFDSSRGNLAPGQRVFVEISLPGGGELQKVIPYAALIYDIDGGTWVYVHESGTLAFVRQSVTVDYIKDDLAFLTDGPDVGVQVVTVGASELYGAETGVSK